VSFSEVERILGHPLPDGFKTGRRAGWKSRRDFPREGGYRPSFRGVGDREIAFVKTGGGPGRATIWEGLVAWLAGHKGEDVVVSFAEIEELTGLPLEGKGDVVRFRARWYGADKPWTKLGYRVSWEGTPPGQVRFTRSPSRSAEPPIGQGADPKPAPSGDWDGLLRFLQERTDDELVLSFGEVATLRGKPLPPYALWRRSSWSKAGKHWEPLGWYASFRDVPAGHVRFCRAAARERDRRGQRLRDDDKRSARPNMWDPLLAYLAARKDRVTLTARRIEGIIGQSLPPRAFHGPEYWRKERPWSKKGWKALCSVSEPGIVTFYRTIEAGGKGRPRRENPWSGLLERLAGSRSPVVLTFAEIEALVGRPLGPGAHSSKGFWTNAGRPWIARGWRASRDRTAPGSIRFVRTATLAARPKDWGLLIAALGQAGATRVVLSFEQIEAIVSGRLPPGALRGKSYWQCHARPWYRAGFQASFSEVPAGYVAFEPLQPRRKAVRQPARKKFNLAGRKASLLVRRGRRKPDMPLATPGSRTEAKPAVSAVIVQGTGSTPLRMTRARRFFDSPEFHARCGIAEACGAPWLILDAIGGLVGPDEFLSPRSQSRPDLWASRLGTWRVKLIQRLTREVGDLAGKTIAVLASAEVAQVIADLLLHRGATAVGTGALLP